MFNNYELAALWAVAITIAAVFVAVLRWCVVPRRRSLAVALFGVMALLGDVLLTLSMLRDALAHELSKHTATPQGWEMAGIDPWVIPAGYGLAIGLLVIAGGLEIYARRKHRSVLVAGAVVRHLPEQQMSSVD